jgi:hypothetical protein
MYYWMSQANIFGICHPDDGGYRFVGNVTQETRNQMTVKSQAGL